MRNAATSSSGAPSPRARAEERALSEVAKDLLRAGVGARMTTSLELQERLDVGSGTVQKATRRLVEIGAARLRVRGHQGTVIEALDPVRVWRAAGLPPLRIVLPPPGAIESTAIGLGVRRQLAAAGIPVELDFVRGARRRAVRLAGTDLPVATLMSKGAAQGLRMTDESEYSRLDFGPQSYYHANSLVRLSRRGAGRKGQALRVAMDPDSFDHTVLTEREFGGRPGVEFVDCPFVQVPRAILDGVADAGVWHRLMTTITPEHAGLVVAPLASPPGADEDDFTSALLVWPARLGEIDSLLSTIDVTGIIAQLNELVALGVDSPEVREIVPWV
jgi:YhfZ C-terminal domain/Helix-turn-helix domain